MSDGVLGYAAWDEFTLGGVCNSKQKEQVRGNNQEEFGNRKIHTLAFYLITCAGVQCGQHIWQRCFSQ